MKTANKTRRKRSSGSTADGAGASRTNRSNRGRSAGQRGGRSRGALKSRSKDSQPIPKELSEDVKRAIEGMSPEDAAAYVKVQVLGADSGTAPSKDDRVKSTPAKSSTTKKAAVPAPAPATSDAKPGKPQRSRRRKKQTSSDRSQADTKATEESSGKTSTGERSAKEARTVSEDQRKPAGDQAAAPVEPSVSATPARVKKAPARKQPALGNGRVMVINSASGDECRIAILHERKLEEFFIERSSSVSHVGNIYKGRIANVEPSIQAVFVEFGLAKHGFLHISDVQPQYFLENAEPEGVGRKVPRRDRPPIQTCFKRGQEVIVQVIKEGLGTKGPTLSTYLSIPGRYLVMMPGMTRLGVSRKIEDEETRRKMRSVLGELTLPKDMGFILRTSGEGRTKRDLQRDLTYLHRLWKMVAQRVRSTKAPSELYRESDLVTRTVRDVFTSDFDRIIVDTPKTMNDVREFLRIALPRSPEKIVEEYDGPVPIFHHYGIEDQLEAIHDRHVPLKSGGSIVIDQTEAMVAIDVNSGRTRNIENEEETAFKTDIEAAQEIARQLRLRDLGGLIVCDFIDMRLDRHKRAVERELREALKKHKEKARILRMSQFGLIEMTRQRQGPSIKRGIYTDCPHCKGSGLVKSPESMTLHVLRNVQKAVYQDDISKLTVTVSPDVANFILNRKRNTLHTLEASTEKSITIRSNPSFTWDEHEYEAEDFRGRKVSLFTERS